MSQEQELSKAQSDTFNTLKSMGFDEVDSITAAQIFGADINAAVSYLTNDSPILYNDFQKKPQKKSSINEPSKSPTPEPIAPKPQKLNTNNNQSNINQPNQNDLIQSYLKNNNKSPDEIYIETYVENLTKQMQQIVNKLKHDNLNSNSTKKKSNEIFKRDIKSEFGLESKKELAPLSKEEEAKNNETNKLITSKLNNKNLSEKDIEDDGLVYKATWFGDVLSLRNYPSKILNNIDKHGNTALSLAIRLGHDSVAHELLSIGADPRIELPVGWNIIQESVLNQDHRLVRDLLIHQIQLRSCEYEERKKIIIDKLSKMKNFKLEIKWQVQSSLAVLNNLINKFAKIDNFKIWKQDKSIRFDMFMRGFSANGVQKGHISLLFTEHGIINVDHDYNTYTNAIRKYKNPDYDDLETEIRIMMKTEQGRAMMATKNVKFTKKKDWLNRDKKEVIDNYQCDVYSANGLNYGIIEHKKKNNNNDDWKHPSFDEYFMNNNNNKKKNISFHPNYIKIKNQPIDVTIWITKNHPLNDDDISIVLEAISIASEDMRKLADIFKLKFPKGFPVQLNLPIVVGISASATFCNFQFCENDKSLFEVPDEYRMI